MESLLRGIPDVAVYLDYILITGKTEEEQPRSGSYEDVTGRAATKTMQMFIPSRECNIPGTSNISPVPLSRARKSQRHQGSSQAGKYDKT